MPSLYGARPLGVYSVGRWFRIAARFSKSRAIYRYFACRLVTTYRHRLSSSYDYTWQHGGVKIAPRFMRHARDTSSFSSTAAYATLVGRRNMLRLLLRRSRDGDGASASNRHADATTRHDASPDDILAMQQHYRGRRAHAAAYFAGRPLHASMPLKPEPSHARLIAPAYHEQRSPTAQYMGDSH